VKGIFYRDGTLASIKIKGNRIAEIVRKPSFEKPGKKHVFVAPGLIDNQVNGYISVAFADEGLTVEGIRKATESLWQAGVTTFLPTLTTNSRQLLLQNFRILAQALQDPQLQLSIPGFHLEGPYISPLDGFRGAHLKKWVRPPDWQEFMEFYQAADGKILEVSLAPEIEGAMNFINRCRELGIVVALAHHNASAEIIKRAVDAGAALSTHLGNGCSNMINRHENPLWPQLADDRLMASIIVDGFHLRPEEVQVFYKVKGPERILLTSDVTHLAGMPPGQYTAKGRTIMLSPEGKIKLTKENILAGAALPITRGIGNLMRFTQCSLAEAIHAAGCNQARLFGLKDRGELTPGMRADLIFFTVDDYVMHIKKTVLAGKVVYEAE